MPVRCVHTGYGLAGVVGARGRGGCQVDQGVQQLPDPEVQHGSTEQHRGRPADALGGGVEGQAARGEQVESRWLRLPR